MLVQLLLLVYVLVLIVHDTWYFMAGAKKLTAKKCLPVFNERNKSTRRYTFYDYCVQHVVC